MNKEGIEKLEEINNKFKNIEKMLNYFIERKKELLNDGLSETSSETSYDELKANEDVHGVNEDDIDANEVF